MSTLPRHRLPRNPVSRTPCACEPSARVGHRGHRGQRLMVVLALLATFGALAAFGSGATPQPLAQSVLVASLAPPQPLCGGGPTPCP